MLTGSPIKPGLGILLFSLPLHAVLAFKIRRHQRKVQAQAAGTGHGPAAANASKVMKYNVLVCSFMNLQE